MLQQLIAIGFDINERNYAGQTTLSTSCEHIDRAELAQVLVKNGADPYRTRHGYDFDLARCNTRKFGLYAGSAGVHA